MQDLKAVQEKLASLKEEGNESLLEENNNMRNKILALEKDLKTAEEKKIQLMENEEEIM